MKGWRCIEGTGGGRESSGGMGDIGRGSRGKNRRRRSGVDRGDGNGSSRSGAERRSRSGRSRANTREQGGALEIGAGIAETETGPGTAIVPVDIVLEGE